MLLKRGRRGRDERRGLPHDIHSLQELYPHIPGASRGLCWDTDPQHSPGKGVRVGFGGGFTPKQERCCPLTSARLSEEQEDELLDAYTTPSKVGTAPNPRALPSDRPGNVFISVLLPAGLPETKQFHPRDAAAQAGAVLPQPLRALLPWQLLPEVGQGSWGPC